MAAGRIAVPRSGGDPGDSNASNGSSASRLLGGAGFAVLLAAAPAAALAHERFVQHDLRAPLDPGFFQELNPDMLNIAGRVMVVMSLVLATWFLRGPIDNFVEQKLLWRAPQRQRRWLHTLASFITDKPIPDAWFERLGRWSVTLFLRVPALVLMYSATNDALVMPSYPLEPSTAPFFKYAQVLLSLGIVTQTLLPFLGAAIVGTYVYLLYAFDWKVAVDALPVLTVAVVYVSAPWSSFRRPVTSLTRQQLRWVRIILGFSLFALGWLKLYNRDLTVGVADNFPSVLNDPLIELFYAGTNPGLQREAWVVAFGLSEVLTGFLLMAGVLNRVWCLFMAYVFTKLLIVDFGWAEIPHLYPIGAFLAVAFSNGHSDELYALEKAVDYDARRDKTALEVLLAVASAVAIAVAVIMPALFVITRVPPP